MVSDARNLAFLKYYDPVGMSYRSDPLSYDKGRGSLGLVFKRLTKLCVCRVIKRRRTVIEYEYLGLFKKRSCNGEPLPLTAGEITAALLYQKIELAGFLFDEIPCLSDLKSRQNSEFQKLYEEYSREFEFLS